MRMPMFHVVRRRDGPQYDHALPLEDQSGWSPHADFMDELVEKGVILLGGPLSDEMRVVLVFEAATADEVRATLERDPWHETHLTTESVDPWTIRLDGRRESATASATRERPT